LGCLRLVYPIRLIINVVTNVAKPYIFFAVENEQKEVTVRFRKLLLYRFRRLGLVRQDQLDFGVFDFLSLATLPAASQVAHS